jgi:hypothetical protein
MDPGTPARRGWLRRSRVPWLVLSALIVLSGVAQLVTCMPHVGLRDVPKKEHEALTVLASALARQDPETWAGLEPIAYADLGAAQPPSDGALRVVAPQGRVLDVRPRVRWSGVPIDARFEVRMLPANPEAEPLWISHGTGRFADFPPEARTLVPGTYHVEVAPAPGSPGARTTFEVASEAARARLTRVLAFAKGARPGVPELLVVGHACVRLGFLLEAERRAQAALTADPKSAAALALLRYVHAQLGESEGWGR